MATTVHPSYVEDPAISPSWWNGRLAAGLEQLLVVVLDPDYPDLLKPGQVEGVRRIWAEYIESHPHLDPFVTGETRDLLGRDVTLDEEQIARLTRDWAVPVMDLPERCDRCHGTDTRNPEEICDDCMADLDNPAIDGAATR